MASGRRQIILSVEAVLEKPIEEVRDGREHHEALVVQNVEPLLLDDIVNGGSFEGRLGFHGEECVL